MQIVAAVTALTPTAVIPLNLQVLLAAVTAAANALTPTSVTSLNLQVLLTVVTAALTLTAALPLVLLQLWEK